jgi:alkylation response protein AidB-like acyl-CoA dehydrogenase
MSDGGQARAAPIAARSDAGGGANGRSPGGSPARSGSGVGIALRAMRLLAGSDVLDRVGARKRVERALFRTTRTGLRTASAAGRTFKSVRRGGSPARQPPSAGAGLFDVTPDAEQAMIQQTVREYAAAEVRPAAAEADASARTPGAILAQVGELGVNTLGVPEQLGGAMHGQSAVTAVLVGEALSHGDMGVAYAALAPGAVATAIGRWGTADQQATYLPAFTGEDPPAAALALLEPGPLFDPMRPRTTAVREPGGWVLEGAKALVARAGECELFVIAADAAGIGPSLFVLEPGAPGLAVQAEPAMGLRAAATGRLLLERVRVGEDALLGESAREGYVECVQRARIAWCALAVGLSQAVLDYVIPYVKERMAFGEPIADRQSVAFAVSDIAIESSGMRLATYRAAGLADQQRDFAQATAIARALCARHGMRIGSEGVQLLGGHGYTKEHPVERWYRDLRAAGVMEGALLV